MKVIKTLTSSSSITFLVPMSCGPVETVEPDKSTKWIMIQGTGPTALGNEPKETVRPTYTNEVAVVTVTGTRSLLVDILTTGTSEMTIGS